MPTSLRAVIGSTLAFLVVGLLALLAIVGAAVWLAERAQGYFDQSIAARDTRGAIVAVRSALQTAESSQRGFMVGGNEAYLAPYDSAKSDAERQLGQLRELLAAYPDSETQLDRLQGLVSDKFDEMDRTIVLKRSGHDDQALALFGTDKGKALMDQANTLLTGLVGDADSRLTTLAGEQRTNADWLRIVAGIGALVIIVVVAATAFTLLRYAGELRRAQNEVKGLNAVLEERVAHRTADLVSARERAEVLLSEVNHRVANSLALVSSLVSLQAKAISDPAAKNALAETQDRIFAVSLVHRRLYDAPDARVVNLDEYLAGLLDHLKSSLRSDGQNASLAYTLERIQLRTDKSVSLGVIVTEWVTNAFKYAYPAPAVGEIRVRLAPLSAGQAELTVEDDGIGRADDVPAKGTGLGSRIVTAMASNLGGEVRYDDRRPGTTARLIFSRDEPPPAN